MAVALVHLLLAMQIAQPAPVLPPTIPSPNMPGPMDDGIRWEALPDIPYRQPPVTTPAMHAWARAQVRAGRCRVRRLVDGRPAVRVEVAVLIHPEDGVRTAVPRAIGCPAVEQYSAGLVTSFARNNLAARTSAAEQWYKATVTFAWER